MNDAVFYLGSSYRSLVAGNVNAQPDASPASWALFAAGGGSGNATLTAGGLLASTANSTIGYTFGNTNNGNGSGVNTRSNGLWGRIGSGTSGNLPVGTAVPSGVGLSNTNFAIGTLGTATGNSVGVVGSVGTAGAVGVWGHNDNTAGSTGWNVGVIGTSAGTGNAATGVFGQANRGVSGSSGLAANGSNPTQANRLPGGGVYGATTSTNGNAGFFLGRVVIENTFAAGAPTNDQGAGSPDPFIVWTNSGASGFNRSGALFTPSDRNSKSGFTPVDGVDVLNTLVNTPVTRWHYKGDDTTWYMGPMAQDFKAAFNLGDKDTVIHGVNADGVALAAIQGLNTKLEAALKQRDQTIAAQQQTLASMEARIAKLESASSSGGTVLIQRAGIGLGVLGLPLLGIALWRRRGGKRVEQTGTNGGAA